MSADTPLFPDLPESLSPFLAWKRANKIITFHSIVGDPDWDCWFASADSGEFKYTNTAEYFAQECGQYGDSRSGEGSTEQEACESYCLRFGVKHWSIQP